MMTHVDLRRRETDDPPAGIVSTLILRRIDAWGAAAVSAAIVLIIHDAVAPRTTGLLASIALLYWFGYTINDYFDAPFDACDDDKARSNFFVSHTIAPKVLAIVAVAVSVCLLAAFATFGVWGLAAFAIANLAMWGYSAPPIRLKSRPGLDLITHGLFVLTFPYLVALLLVDVSWTRLDGLLLGLIFLTSVGGQLSQQIRDFDVDSRTDLNFTTTVGITTSILWLRVTTVVTVLIAVLAIAQGVIPGVVIVLGLVCLPVMFNRVTARPGRKPSVQPSRWVAIAALLYSTVVVRSSLLN